MKIQKILNKLFSIIFRIILVSFGISIVILNDNYFEIYWYYVAVIPYFIVYFKTLFRENIYSKIRLLNDFVFITFILYGKGLDFISISYLFLPIINSPNHSGKKKSLLLYIFFLLSLFIINSYTFNLSFLFVTITLLILSFIVDSRKRYLDGITKLNEKIEDFFEHQLELRKSYKIYEGILSVLNNKRLLIFYKPKFDNIICIQYDDDNITLVNSSTFVWSYEIDRTEIDELLKKGFRGINQSDISFKMNERIYSKNFILYNKTKKNQYLYIITLKDKSNNILNIYYINLLQSIISRVSRALDLENSLKEENKRILNIFRKKYFYMQNAEKAMHFIRNRFNSLDNFIELSKENIKGEMDKEDLEMYSDELINLERNYKMLMGRVKTILTKSDKPFSATQLELKSPNYLFGIFRDIWLDYFNNFSYELKWDIEDIFNYQINLNQDGLYILVTDWVNNLTKHSLGQEKIIFYENSTTLFVSIINKYNKNREQELKELENDFNSNDKDRILQRTSHGVIIMKSILEEMSVIGKINIIENDFIELLLQFKKEK